MASLRYRIRGFGIRGYYYTKNDWEVKTNVYMTVKRSDRGALSVYTDQDVRAGSIPQELQEVLGLFLRSKPSSVIKVKVTSMKSVFKKGEEIPCDIELICEDGNAVGSAIGAIKEDIKKLKKKQPELSFMKMPSTNKKTDDKRPVQNAVADKACAKTNGVKKESKNSSDNNKKRKQTLDNNNLTGGPGPKIRKTEASTSATQSKLGATDKQIKKLKKQGKEISVRKMPSNSKNSSNNNKKRKRTLDNNHLTEGSGTKIRKTEASTSATQTKLGATDKKIFTFRYQYLLIEIGAEVLRMVFNQLVNNDFMHYLNAYPTQYNQLKFLMNKHIITESQQMLLPPKDNKPSSSMFDITLLACLLRNVCGLCQRKDPVWDSDDPTDLSVEADITRLRKCRNNLAHSATVFISETNSTSLWNELSVILNRLGNKYGNANLLSKISAAHDMDIDEERKDHYDETLKLWLKMDQLFGKVMQKLDSLQNGQAEIKEDVSEIKEDVSETKEEVSEIKEDVSEIKEDVSEIKEDVAEIKKHLKKNDTVNQRQNQLGKDDCYKLSKHIGSNWKFLGFELGITHVQIEQIMDDSRTTRGRIEQMLSMWIDEQGQHATIDKFITAMEACEDLSFNKRDIYLYFEELKKKCP